jgi:MFS family permease
VRFSVYRQILGIREARNALLLGLLVRAPMWAGAIILTLHVVTRLGHSYAAAGLLTAASTAAFALSGPWRGRLLDVRGLRRTLLPQLGVLAVVWSVAPWVGYGLLLPLAFIGGLFVVPTFSIVRQVLISSVDDHLRTAALSLDSFFTQLTFMVGPVLGVLAATYFDTRWALFGAEMLTVVGGILIWIQNPRLIHEDDWGTDQATRQGAESASRRSWMSPLVIGILAATAASTLVVTGPDLGVVAALRSMGHPESIGWVIAIWALGTGVGALVNGALNRSLPVFVALGLLAIATLPGALAPNRGWLALSLFVAGLFYPPVGTGIVERLSRLVPARARGEVLGWHGSALTVGEALGALIAGVAIDRGGWQAAFVVTATVGLVVSLAGMVATTRTRAATPVDQTVGSHR